MNLKLSGKLVLSGLLVFFLSALSVEGQPQQGGLPSVDPAPALLMEASMQALYDFDFALADKRSSEMLRKFPGHYLSHFTRVQYLWWMIITQAHDPLLEDAFFESLGLSLAAIRPYLEEERSLEHRFYFINVYAMQARLYLTRKEYLRTISSLKHCIDQIEATLGQEQSYPPLYLSSGMYNYMLEHARQKYPFLALYMLLYPRGDVELGLRQLQMAALSESFIWKTEASYLLMKIYQDIEGATARAMPVARALVETYPSNLLFRMHYIQILESLGEEAEARSERAALQRATRQARGISEAQRIHLLGVFGG